MTDDELEQLFALETDGVAIPINEMDIMGLCVRDRFAYLASLSMSLIADQYAEPDDDLSSILFAAHGTLGMLSMALGVAPTTETGAYVTDLDGDSFDNVPLVVWEHDGNGLWNPK